LGISQTVTAAERFDIVRHDWTKNAAGARQVAEKREKYLGLLEGRD
jgi:hypothetical protein